MHYFQCNFYNYALIKLISKFQDAHGNQFGQTVKDKSQDYKLIVGYQYQDNTVLRFKRKINTCDTEDLAITVNIPIIQGVPFTAVFFQMHTAPIKMSDFKNFFTGKLAMISLLCGYYL